MNCWNESGCQKYLFTTANTGSKAQESDHFISKASSSSQALSLEAPHNKSCNVQDNLDERNILQGEQRKNQEGQKLDIHQKLNHVQSGIGTTNMLSISARETNSNEQKGTVSTFQRMKYHEQHHRSCRLGVQLLPRQREQHDSKQVSFANDLSQDGLIMLHAAYDCMASMIATRRQGRFSADTEWDQFTSRVEQQRKKSKPRPRRAFHSSTKTAPSA